MIKPPPPRNPGRASKNSTSAEYLAEPVFGTCTGWDDAGSALEMTFNDKTVRVVLIDHDLIRINDEVLEHR
jgi:hypothetical protein